MLKKSWLFIFFVLFTQNVFAADFNKIFQDWTYAFNHKDVKKSCDIFANNLIADYQGFPSRNYTRTCDGFKKIFAEKERQFRYKFKIRDVYEDGNLAAVRITWYFTVLNKNGKKISETQDEGIDIFQKNKAGEWEIVNYLAYEKK